MMREVSRQSGVHIVAATGSHQAIPRVLRTASADAIAPLFIKEVEEGIENTGVKAGVIKSASDRGGVTELEETGFDARVFRPRDRYSGRCSRLERGPC